MADETEEASDPKADAETRSVAPFIDDEDDEPTPADAEATDTDGGDEAESDEAEAGETKASTAAKDAKAKGAKDKDEKAAEADRTVVRRQVTSKRVTPKGGPVPASKKGSNKGNPAESSRYTPPAHGAYAKGPSPWWVPALMFGLLLIGAVIIMTNYMGVFGTASNIRLIIGLGFILGGIITATQYR